MLSGSLRAEFLNLRRAHIEREFGFLNDTQRRAVFKTEGPLLLLAGAGSGKTTVIINRIANIIKYGNAYNSDEIPDRITDMDVEILREYIKSGADFLKESAENICALNPAPPWQIIAITFTNKAANELKERLARAVGEEKADDIWAATFHSACVRILRRDIDKLGYDSSFTIYDSADSERVIKDVLAEMSIDTKAFPPRAVQTVISRAKDSMLSPSAFEKDSEGNFRLEKIAAVYKKYQARLKGANALDFDDIIMLTVNLLSGHRDVLDYYRRKFRYVLVDEYQDTNHAQYLLAALLAGGSGNICVVGDDDQSIYRFRGATIENILNFEEQFKNAEVIRLEQNYRSTNKILEIANSVIKNNMGRKGKNLWTENNDGPLPVVYHAENERDEAAYIAEQILAAKAAGAAFSDCAVLYRTNAQSMQIERVLKFNGIHAKIVGGKGFFERAEVKDMLAYLCVISNPTDTLRLKRIINVPSRKIGDKTVETIELLAQRDNTYAFDVISRADEYPELSRNASALREFASIINTIRGKLGETALGELYDELITKTGYTQYLLAEKDGKEQTRLENVMELKSSIIEYEKQENASLAGFLEEVSLFTDLDNFDSSDDNVTLMTVHSAKGLEFPIVFITGLEEGMFPSLREFDELEIEEERRLFYVATTRAKRELHMIYAHTRLLFGQTKYGKKSRFISEIPAGLVEEKGFEPQTRSWSFSDDSGSGYSRNASFGSGQSARRSQESAGNWSGEEIRPRRKTTSGFSSSFTSTAQKADSPVPCNLSAGDRILHKAFKEGLVISANPVGGDVLLEIAFDSVGTKRLLYKTASKFITKL
ncbi:MAG: UvrD-helicase domain-containing protein [Oscillospiraceae bacterium]|nr:UvrD-helicase domain-containing protein [Oscillospiraceae bacterium]